MATYTFLAGINGTYAGTADADLFIWPATGGSIDIGDTFFGAGGTDTLRIDGSTSLTFTLAQFMGGIEVIQVQAGAAALITIGAGAGAPDTVAGLGAVLTMNGAELNDRLDTSARAAGYAAVFDAGAGNDTFLGGAGDDTVAPGFGDDVVSTGAGNDVITYVIASDDPAFRPLRFGDVLNGGTGTDKLVLTGSSTQVLDLTEVSPLIAISRIEIIDASGLGGVNVRYDNTYLYDGGGIIVLGGAGADKFSGASGADQFFAGAGADTMFGALGNDTLYIGANEIGAGDLFVGGTDVGGGTETDTILITASGILTADGAARFNGFERIELFPGGLSLTLLAMPNLGDAQVDRVFGSYDKDRLDATGLVSEPGRSLFFAGDDGRDTLLGAPVRNVALGGADNDYLRGGRDGDSLLGESGNDQLIGLDGDDTLEGGAGNDRILAGNGRDLVVMALRGQGGARDDTGSDTVLMGAGQDTVQVINSLLLDANDWIAGGADTDTLLLDGVPLILGAAERIGGFERVVIRNASAGTVVQIGDAMATSVFGRMEVVLLGASAGVRVDAGAVTQEAVIFNGSDPALGSGFGADTLISGLGGGFFGNIRGADSVVGGAGQDFLTVRLDQLDPGARFSGGGNIDQVTITGRIAWGDTTLARFGGFEVAVLDRNVANEVLLAPGSIPADVATFGVGGGNLDDRIDGSAATLALELAGGDGDDELTGGAGADTIDGGLGSDVIAAGAGNDRVVLAAFEGDDIADGGAGIDTVSIIPGTRSSFGASDLLGLSGFEVLQVTLGGGRLALPNAMVQTGGLVVEVSAGAGQSTALFGTGVTRRLDLRGGAGNDWLVGGSFGDRILDGTGSDRLRGFLGADTIALALDGTADRIVYALATEGSADIAGGAGTAAQADVITGFNVAGDAANVIELVRAGFAGIGARSGVDALLAGEAIDIDAAGAAALFLVAGSDRVGGAGFADLAAVNLAFGGRIDATAPTGTAAFVVAYGTNQAGLYYYVDGDDVAGIGTADTLRLLAVIQAPGTLGASDFAFA